jgi:hypothetical protein
MTAQDTERRRSDWRKRKAVAWRDQTIAKLFSEIKRVRPLNDDEKQMFDRALAGAGPKCDKWRWSEKEDRKLLALMRKRQRIGRPKPFQPNMDVMNLAIEFGRTYMAVHRRIERLRKQMKCSDARKAAKR